MPVFAPYGEAQRKGRPGGSTRHPHSADCSPPFLLRPQFGSYGSANSIVTAIMRDAREFRVRRPHVLQRNKSDAGHTPGTTVFVLFPITVRPGPSCHLR